MTFDLWVKRLETIFGEQAKWSSKKEDEYVCSFKGSGTRNVKKGEIKGKQPFYCLFHFYYYGTYTQIHVNKRDFIRIAWNRKGKNIRAIEFAHNIFPTSRGDFSNVSEQHKNVVDWVFAHYGAQTKNRLEIITRQ